MNSMFGLNLGGLSLHKNCKTRSISAENYKGEKGKGGMATEGTGKNAARDLGLGWKVSPSISIEAGATVELADIEGPGVIQQIWYTCHFSSWRSLILRYYWDNEQTPSVESPIGDLFCNGWCDVSLVTSLPVAVNPRGGLNSFWEMPFRKHARITIENIGDKPVVLYYQINYALCDVPDDAAYFHAQFRRINPLAYKSVYTILDGVRGKGHYVGTYMAWGVNNNGWWGEGEIKFFLDGDEEFPTICGTGTEDYFLGAWDFEMPQGQYREFSNIFSGLNQVIRPDGLYKSQTRFSMYRWHIMDPVCFEEDLKVTIQALGWRSGGRYLPGQDDIASVAFWYQSEPHAAYPQLPDKDYLEVI